MPDAGAGGAGAGQQWLPGAGATPGGQSPFALAYAKHLQAGGQVPGFGLLGAGGEQPQGSAQSPGQAAALPDRPAVTPLGLPEVLAACAVAAVGGLLARTWTARAAKS